MSGPTPMREEFDRLVASGLSAAAARARVNGRSVLESRQPRTPLLAHREPPATPRTPFAPHVPVPRYFLRQDAQPYRVDIVERLDGLFTRDPAAWGSRSALPAFFFLADALEAGEVRLRLERIPASVCAKAGRAKRYFGVRTESAEHKYLKVVAREWLRSIGGHDAANEVQINGRADAYSAKLDWIVECGHTPVEKLADAIVLRPECKFTLVPYQDRYAAMERKPAQSLRAVTFTWSTEYGKALVERSRAAMRASADARRAALSGRMAND